MCVSSPTWKRKLEHCQSRKTGSKRASCTSNSLAAISTGSEKKTPQRFAALGFSTLLRLVVGVSLMFLADKEKEFPQDCLDPGEV